MARTNTGPSRSALRTHEGAPAKRISAEAQLRRTVMACLLWENTFYEDGVDVAKRIADEVKALSAEKVSAIAIEARSKMNLRHAPLLLAVEMARTFKGAAVSKTIEAVIQRADELSEFLSLYWRDGRCPLSKQAKRGLALAFVKFNEYALAKYNRDTPVKLRDVLFLCHAKPKDDEQADLWKRLIDGKLQTPDTWEVALSAGDDKRETFQRLIAENKLGGLALLRNLRNMTEAKVPRQVIRDAITSMKTDRILPFRFVAAARYAPMLEPELETAMFKSIGNLKLDREVTLLVDVSGSMQDPLSAKSDMRRVDAACALAMILREVAKQANVYSFNDSVHAAAPRRGFALRDAILPNLGGGTRLGDAVSRVVVNHPEALLIVITDEQSHDAVPGVAGYLLNVGTAANGVGYGKWTHIDGFSENVVRYIIESER